MSDTLPARVRCLIDGAAVDFETGVPIDFTRPALETSLGYEVDHEEWRIGEPTERPDGVVSYQTTTERPAVAVPCRSAMTLAATIDALCAHHQTPRWLWTGEAPQARADSIVLTPRQHATIVGLLRRLAPPPRGLTRRSRQIRGARPRAARRVEAREASRP